MTFTEELYERTTRLYSGMTTRGFSKICGKSPSYISSVIAQNLEISNTAIVALMTEMEQRKAAHINAGATNRSIERISDLQAFMANEIAKRSHLCATNQNSKIRHMLLEAVSNLADRELDSRTAMPMFIG